MIAALSLRSTRSKHDPKLIAKLAAAAHAIRTVSIAAIYHAGSGHPAGALSVADVLAVLYGAEMNLWPNRLDDPDRDRCVLAAEHAAPGLYAAGAHFGFCSAGDALTLGKLMRRHQAHPTWMETNTGSPGQGLSVALDMAVGLKLEQSPARVYAVLSGALKEDEVSEAAMRAAHLRADNLLAIVDCTPQSDLNGKVTRLEPLGARFRAFGWHVIEIDGHDLDAILGALEEAFEVAGKPSLILARTVKGVAFMESAPHWQGSVTLSHQQAEDALKALGCTAQECARWLDVSR